MKNYLRTQITLYEEDKNYPIWRRQERRSKYAVQLASWQLRSNSPKTSVRPSVRPTSRVRSVAPTVFVGSISYLYILSSNFRRCVACIVSCNISKFVTLTLSCFDWDLVWITSMGNHGAAEGISECRRSSCSSLMTVIPFHFIWYIYALDILRFVPDLMCVCNGMCK